MAKGDKKPKNWNQEIKRLSEIIEAEEVDKDGLLDAFVDRSEAFLGKLDLDNAWEDITAAEKLCAEDSLTFPWILHQKGLITSKRDLFDEAREFYNEGWKLAKGHENECLFPYNISVDYEAMGDFGRATKFLRDAKKLGWALGKYDIVEG